MKIPWTQLAEFIVVLAKVAADFYRLVNGLPGNPTPTAEHDTARALRTAALVIDPDRPELNIDEAESTVADFERVFRV